MNVDAHYYRDRLGRHVFRVDWTDTVGRQCSAPTKPAVNLETACERLAKFLAAIQRGSWSNWERARP